MAKRLVLPIGIRGSWGMALMLGAPMVAGCNQDSKSEVRKSVTAPVPASESAAPAASTARPAVTAAASVSVSPPKQRVRRLSDNEVNTRITPLLRANETLAHAVFEGPFGPEKGATLILTKVSGEGLPVLGGWVFVGGEDKRADLPELSFSMHIFETVAAVVPLDVDADPALEIIILGTIIGGVGPYSGHYLPHNVVLDWDGAKFVQLSDVEMKIGDAKDVAQVKKALGK